MIMIITKEIIEAKRLSLAELLNTFCCFNLKRFCACCSLHVRVGLLIGASTLALHLF